MTDPLSIFTGVLAITGAVIESSKALFLFAGHIKHAPKDIKTIYKDVQSLYSIIFQLNLALNGKVFRKCISSNQATMEMIAALEDPIHRSQAIMEELMLKLRKLHEPRSEVRSLGLSSVRWAMKTKNEISMLQCQLEAAKTTIMFGLQINTIYTELRLFDIITTLTGGRSPAIMRDGTIGSISRLENATHVSLVTDSGVTGAAAVVVDARRSSFIPSTCLDQEIILNNMHATHMQLTQVADAVKLIIGTMQTALILGNRSLLHDLAQAYQNLGRVDGQIHELRKEIDRCKTSERALIVTTSDSDSNVMANSRHPPNWDSIGDKDAINIFFDCVSRFSSDDSTSAISGLYASFCGSPISQFESMSSVFPEHYALNGFFDERGFAVAMLPSSEDNLTMRYFLTYAETARRWRRIILSITFHDIRKPSNIMQISIPDSQGSVCMLPREIQSLLKVLLLGFEFNKPVTKLQISLREYMDGDLIVNSDETEVTDNDDSEVQLPDEANILEDLDAMNCPIFVESDVAVQSRIKSYRYKVYLRSQPNQPCIERKIPFASAGRPGENAYQEFLNDIKLHIAWRHCNSVVKLRGIVLDDSRKYLRNYLIEHPMVMSLELMLGVANSRAETIPWLIRESWIRQILKATVILHSRGIISGWTHLNGYGVRADGTVVLMLLTDARGQLRDLYGEMPPELRDALKKDDTIMRKN